MREIEWFEGKYPTLEACIEHTLSIAPVVGTDVNHGIYTVDLELYLGACSRRLRRVVATNIYTKPAQRQPQTMLDRHDYVFSPEIARATVRPIKRRGGR